ncbi:MAG: cation transporter [Nitrospira sp.]|nr:cation transporter [Nitrospira sp.]
MKTTRFLRSCVVIAGMLWVGISAGALLQEAGAATEQPGEITTLKIEGWTCASCEKGIRRALLAVPGVKHVDVRYDLGGAVLTIEPNRVSQEQLVKAVASAGNILSSYRATVVPNGTLTAQAGEKSVGWKWFENLFK